MKDAVFQLPLRKTSQSAKRMMMVVQQRPHQAANGVSLLYHGRFLGSIPWAFKPCLNLIPVRQIPSQLNIPETALMLENQLKTVLEESLTPI